MQNAPLLLSALTEAEERAAIVAEARSWIGTKYHHHACVKGHGVDCALLLWAVFSDTGLIERFDPGDWPPDWMMHRDEERYAGTIERFAKRQLDEGELPLPGDIAVWRFGRSFSHGAIVIAWPNVIHAYAQSGSVDLCNVEQDSRLMWLSSTERRPLRFYSLWSTP